MGMKKLSQHGSSLLELGVTDLCFSFLPCRSWRLLFWHTPCSGPLAYVSTQPSLAATSLVLTPSSLSTVPMSKLPETLPGIVQRLRCCPWRLRELPGCSRGATLGPFSCFWQPCPYIDELHNYLLGMVQGAQLNDPLTENVEHCMGVERGIWDHRDRRL
jgi:hypothetical protein